MIVRIHLGLQDAIELGNIEAKRDWGYAPDYVNGMWKILNHEEADDFVLATGTLHSVKEFLEIAFGYFNLDYRQYLKINPDYFRPLEEVHLVGNPSKAKLKLAWESTKNLQEIIEEMIESELKLVQKGLYHHDV